MKAHFLITVSTAVVLALTSGCERQTATSSKSEVQATGQLESCQLGGTPNVHVLEGIYLAGQPKPEDFQVAKTEGIKTIINLRHAKEMADFDEAAVATSAGLEYIHMPWNGADELTDEIFQQGREHFESASRPMLMHCGSANRVGALWIPWRVLDGNVSVEAAVTEAQTIGLKSAEYEQKARDYIDRNKR